MTKHSKTLAILTALAATASIPAAAQAADNCPNATIRAQQNSNALPDCRAYELVSPDINHASLGSGANGKALPDGSSIGYMTIDSPETSPFGSLNNYVIAKRDPADGWSGEVLGMRLSKPSSGFFGSTVVALSSDLSAVFSVSDQGPAETGPTPPGSHLWVTRADGTTSRITNAGNPFFNGPDIYQGWEAFATYYDFSDVFFKPGLAQLPSDPAPGASTYHWSNGHLSLLGILPDGTPAPFGSNLLTSGLILPPVSEDGKHALFSANGDPASYLRSDDPEIDGDEETVEFAVSQRTVDPDPNPLNITNIGGVTADGSKVLFTSRTELTNDAYTGRSGGVQTDAGNDLYTYDIASGELEDLTANTDPVNAATGANVKQIVAATPNASVIYFTADGILDDGARPGHTSLYVLRDGEIEFVSDADGLQADSGQRAAAMSEDGQAVAFISAVSLTGYDNTDPVTGEPQVEVFLAHRGQPLVCASCRPDGSRPRVSSYLGAGRAVSNGGKRVFFQTADAVLPQSSSTLNQVYQYSGGEVSAISLPDSDTKAYSLDASASGDDVFFATHDTLVENPNGGDFAVYDARVGGGFAIPPDDGCAGSSCQGAPAQAPALPVAGTVVFSGFDGAQGGSTRARVSVAKLRAVTGTIASLRVKVPGKGRLTASGSGLRTSKRSVSKAQTVRLRVALTGRAAKTLRKRKAVRSRVRVAFVDSAGRRSAAAVSLTFKTSGKGR